MVTVFSPGDLVQARGREWVTLPSPKEAWLNLRPLAGGDSDSVLLHPDLELQPVAPARFDLPAEANATVQANAVLLADALRLTLRRGAGPFRSAAQLAFEPRIYQLVPLLMALKLPVPRLLIADDVGIGKTIEAGLILRELIDRGEVDAFSVLCSPLLVEQWTGELKRHFGIDAVAVTAGSAVRLERNLPVAQTLFDAHPYTVVSLDYIKAEKRRDSFARSCPRFVIIDEAHSCVGTHKGRQQRFDLLSHLARDSERAMVMLTATPHSGDEHAFSRLLSLIDPSLASISFEDERYRQQLAKHYVQRRRIDLTSNEWAEERAFPKHKTLEAPYALGNSHLSFHEAVLDYRVGAWPTSAVQRKTLVALLRLRFKLTVHGRRERLLLAEEAGLVALAGTEVIATGAEARALLGVEATHNLAAVARDRIIAEAHADLISKLLPGPLADYAQKRADTLLSDHARLRGATGNASRVTVQPALPPDVIGLFVLLPAGA